MSKPKIRFKGYEEDWEQRKVKEFAIESEVKGHSGKDAKKLTVKLHNKGVYVADEKIQGSDNTQYYIRRAGQFIYGKQNFFNGAIGIVPKKLDKYESTKDVPAFDVSSDVNVDWLYYYIARPEIYKPQEALCTGTGSKRFHVNNFYNLSLAIPKMDEQIKIKEYFVHLDNLITLHQRKCEETKKLKKYMLQKMFPQNGQKVPEIRFSGFTDAWEQRKLGEIAFSFEYGLNAAAKEYDGENKYIRITDIDNNTHEFLTYNLTSPDIDLTDAENYKLAEGDILLARTGASVGKSYIYRDSDGLVYYAGFLIRARIREEYDAEFVFQSTLTDKYNKYIAVTSQRSGQPGMNAQEYSEFEIRVPEKEEQTKIGTYFRILDHLITLHQHKCEQLQSMKKFMLQNMFV